MIPVLTIDGPSGSGKGAVSRRVADRLGWHLLDSGALYRLVALSAVRAGVDLNDRVALTGIATELAARFDSDDQGNERIWLEGEEVTGEVRTEKCGELASQVARVPDVRIALMALQHGYQAPPGLVADGRDMGTVVFPDAPLKIFLMASPEERAKRRHKQLKDKGIGVSLSALSRDIAERDARDANRSVAPLLPAADARTLDSTDLTIDEVVAQIAAWAEDTFGAADDSR